MTARCPAAILQVRSPLQGAAMKSWTQRTLLGLFGAFITFGALTGCSHYRDHAGWGGTAEEQAQRRAKMVDRIAGRLDLNEAQKAKLADLAAKLQAQRAALAGQGDPREQFRALVAGDKFDRAGAQALMSKTAAAIEARSPEVIAALADFYDSLNAQQQAKVREFMQHRRGWWHRG
jgi:Spy/CpxP family protein refolding chaperone